MDYNDVLKENINILHRNLLGLQNSLSRAKISKGQATFIEIYLGIIESQIDKSFDVLDKDKYKEALLDLED